MVHIRNFKCTRLPPHVCQVNYIIVDKIREMNVSFLPYTFSFRRSRGSIRRTNEKKKRANASSGHAYVWGKAIAECRRAFVRIKVLLSMFLVMIFIYPLFHSELPRLGEPWPFFDVFSTVTTNILSTAKTSPHQGPLPSCKERHYWLHIFSIGAMH